VVAGAFPYSLRTIVRGLALQTPLAYIGLVPVIAVALVFVKARPAPTELDIHDRQVDWIVGFPFIAAALLIVLLLPDQLSTRFWELRVDLLAFPLFAIGVVSLLYGVRTLWRVKVAFIFLLLAWPAPWSLWLGHVIDATATLTLSALRSSIRGRSWVAAAPGSDGSLFDIGTGAQKFRVSVASPCSGVNGLVGFAFTGAAFLCVVRGSRVRKLLWLAAGAALTWVFNIGRLWLIFFVGAQWGQGAAIEGLHPFLGLVTFSMAALFMVLLMPRFGLLPAPALNRAQRAALAVKPQAVQRARAATAFVVVCAMILGTHDLAFARYQLVAGDLGAPRLTAFTDAPIAVKGFRLTEVASYDWAKPYFGRSSSWLRYSYSRTHGYGSPIVADVVMTSDLESFSTYGLDACYRFHGYTIKAQGHRELGGGIRAEWLSYHHPKLDADWTVLAWIWPVLTPKGKRYERIVLMYPSQGDSLALLLHVGRSIITGSAHNADAKHTARGSS
jgi:exosortase/archaeosortase family protein